LAALTSAAASHSVALEHIDVREASAVGQGLASARARGIQGVIVASSAVASARRTDIIRSVAEGQVPSVYSGRHFVADGGLMSYGPDLADQYREAATYVDRALRGDDIGRMPVQMPTRFEMALNVRTFRALGRQAPDLLLARADEIFE
jgi:putative ABC transport system substrate-binding protein